jgi:hypothetical protein
VLISAVDASFCVSQYACRSSPSLRPPCTQHAASDNLNQNVWVSGTSVRGAAPFKLVLHDDGNAVIYNGGGEALWGTNTGGR